MYMPISTHRQIQIHTKVRQRFVCSHCDGQKETNGGGTGYGKLRRWRGRRMRGKQSEIKGGREEERHGG